MIIMIIEHGLPRRKEGMESKEFIEFREAVDIAILRKFKEGERFFIRPNLNVKNEYETQWEVGIGIEEEKLIDHHIAKVWRKENALLIAGIMNKKYSLSVGG